MLYSLANVLLEKGWLGTTSMIMNKDYSIVYSIRLAEDKWQHDNCSDCCDE